MRKIPCLVIISLFCLSSIGLTLSTENTSCESSSDIPFQNGWPQETKGPIHSSPVTADLDNDGMKEIIVGFGFTSYECGLYVFHYDGSLMDGWPVHLSSYSVSSSPAIGDLDNDGDLEIVINDDWGCVYVFHHDGTMMDGWPKPIDTMDSTPTLYDLDHDNDLEIIAGTTEYLENPNRMFAQVNIWHHDGTNFDGWPKLISDYQDSFNFKSSAAVGDIDNDGDAEIIIGISARSVNTSDEFIYAWHYNGQLVDGWPFHIRENNYEYCSPILGDLDGDNYLEIIFGIGHGDIYALHHNGSIVSGWPNYGGGSGFTGLALADIDQDSKLEVIAVVSQGLIFVWNDDGSLLEGWSNWVGGWAHRPPVVGDIASDGHLEIIAPSNTHHNLAAWYYNGTPIPGFPLQTGGAIVSSPCIDDIDGDGDVEVIIGSMDKKLYVWDLSHPYEEEFMEWPMYHHDIYHTGEFSFGKGFCADANGPYYNRIDNENVFIGSVLNGEPPFEWHWDFGDGNSSNEQNPTHVYTEVGDYYVNLTVTDALGNIAYDMDLINISLFGKDGNEALRISFKGGFGLRVLIENLGTVDAEGVDWSLLIEDRVQNLDDLIIFPKDGKKSGVIDIPAGESKSFWFFILREAGEDLAGELLFNWIDFEFNFSAKIMDSIASETFVAKIVGLVFLID